MDFDKKQIDYYNRKAHAILSKEISLILQNFPRDRKEEWSRISSLVTGFIRFAYEGISSYLQNKDKKHYKKAFMAMENQVNLKWSKIFHLEDSMVIYGIYNSDTLEN